MLGDALVLGYHAVSPDWPVPMAMHPDLLDRQLGTLVARGYAGVTFTEAATRRHRRPVVAVTFDDGLRSVLDRALPILRRHGLVGTVFVPTDHVGRETPVDWPTLDRHVGGPHEHELLPMSWADLRLLADEGWEISSHTCSHPHLPEIGDAQLEAELAGSRDAIEAELGLPCRAIAYPYGECDARVARATRRAGYTAGAALPTRIHRRHSMRWPRVGIWSSDNEPLFDVKTARIRRRRLDFWTGRLELVPRWRVGGP
jgi:peptidoglycan/xylan/chitin deacetylase (PgdA/CDA1 family)